MNLLTKKPAEKLFLLAPGRLTLEYDHQSKRTGVLSFLDYWIRFDRWQDRVRKIEAEKEKKRLSRFWLPLPKWNPLNLRPLYLTPEREEDVLPYKPFDEQTREERGGLDYDGIERITMMRYLDLSKEHQARLKRYKMLLALQYDQRFIPERLLFLGPDLCAAHFIVNRSGSVKFWDDDRWHCMNEKGVYTLPGRKVDGLYVEAIDASNTQLMFEGFDNMASLLKLRFLSVANCHYMTDWCLGRMNQYEETLEYLDLSNCKRLSAQGLSGLACLKKLKYLRVEGLDHVKDLAKVAMLLEEKIPGLLVIGVNYDIAVDETLKHDQLLSHPNVRQDARGNIFLKDQLGEYFYVKGSIPERPVVDEDDLPLVVSLIRHDAPAVPLDVAEEINKLSDGKLKHYLAGSPSGEWTQETERILRMDLQLKLKNNEFVDAFLYPDSMKVDQLEAERRRHVIRERSTDAGVDKRLLLAGANPGR